MPTMSAAGPAPAPVADAATADRPGAASETSAEFQGLLLALAGLVVPGPPAQATGQGSAQQPATQGSETATRAVTTPPGLPVVADGAAPVPAEKVAEPVTGKVTETVAATPAVATAENAAAPATKPADTPAQPAADPAPAAAQAVAPQGQAAAQHGSTDAKDGDGKGGDKDATADAPAAPADPARPATAQPVAETAVPSQVDTHARQAEAPTVPVQGVQAPAQTAPAAPTAPVAQAAAPERATPAPPAQQLAAEILPLRDKHGEHTLTVALHPADLGPVTVTARVHGTDIQLDLGSATESGREAIRAALPELRRELERAGFTSTLLDTNAGGSAGERRTPWYLPQPGRDTDSGPRAARTEPTATTTRAARPAAGVLDLHA